MATTDPRPTPALEVHDLYKRYGAVEALRGLSFTVPPGAFYGLFGRNGAGKTTAFDCLTGLAGRDRGQIALLGETVGLEPSPTAKLRFAYVGGHIGLYDWLTLQEHLDFIAGFYPTWDPARCEQLKQVFRLPLTQRVSSLSPGQHLQFQLLMALSRHPELLLVDEPGNLDPVVRQRLMATMREILEREQATIVLASHLLDELEGLCTHMCIIDRGTTLAAGSVEELLAGVREVVFRGVRAAPGPVEGLLNPRYREGEFRAVLPAFSDTRAAALAAQLGAEGYEASPVGLEDFFIALTVGCE